jgi:hypothetical protein
MLSPSRMTAGTADVVQAPDDTLPLVARKISRRY